MNKSNHTATTSADKTIFKGAWHVLKVFIIGVLASCALVLLGGVEARSQSALDGFDPGANNRVNALAVQPDGKILVGGDFSALGGSAGTTTRYRIGRLNADGSVDASFNPGADLAVAAIAVQGDGKIIVGGNFTTLGGGSTGTTTRHRIGRLNADGTLDTSFNPGADSLVTAIAVQPDGKILVGGTFTTLGGGGTGTTVRNCIGRLNPDGSLDTSFNPGANISVVAIVVQADGKIIVGGNFTRLGGGGTGTTQRIRLGRLNVDGTLDAAFNPGASDLVNALALQADGKILVGGFFDELGGGGSGNTTRHRIGRLNTDGTLDTSFDPGANINVQTITVQTDGKILVGGDFTMLGGGSTGTTPRDRIGRLNPDGSLDAAFNPGASNSVYTFAVQPDGKIVVGGQFTMMGGGTSTTPRSRIARLYPDGSLDHVFNPGLNSGLNNTVYAIAVQGDGKILIGGLFSSVLGTARNHIARLNSDGTLDTSFNPNANSPVRAIAVQPDGKILVGGEFTTLAPNGGAAVSRSHVARLHPSGLLDTAFDPDANGNVYSITMQPDGRILIGGFFTSLSPNGGASVDHRRIARLESSGLLDASFNPKPNLRVNSIVVQPDGKILVGGEFTTVAPNGGPVVLRNHIARFESSGLLDTAFYPIPNNTVLTIALQPDGRILIGGEFITLSNGGPFTDRRGIARLEPSGLLDTTFDPDANFDVTSILVQLDGRILISGFFTTLSPNGGATVQRNRIARLESSGLLDTAFNPSANNPVRAIAMQADGKILVGGDFTNINGQSRVLMARLLNNTNALQRLSVSFKGTSVRWLRSGPVAELERVVFEVSTDGINYTFLGNGTRLSGGWLLAGLNLPAQQNIYVRARGFYQTGFQTGSYSVVESVRNAFITYNGVDFDFDGDKLSDVSVWNPNNGNWHILQSSDNTTRIRLDWGNGALGDIAVPADYDGDGKCDLAVYRQAEGNFYVIQSQTNAPTVRNWGGGSDIPTPADYDGDGRADYAVFRQSEGNWYILNSTSNTVTLKGWGTSGDKPMPRDYDGDGRADVAVFRQSEGNWYVINSATNTVTVQTWGAATDKLVAADYDGDGLADFAVWRSSEGNWYIRRSTGGVTLRSWGGTGDIAVPADYDGDGLADIAVFRPTEGTWYIIQSATNTVRTAYLGGSGDVPAPATIVR